MTTFVKGDVQSYKVETVRNFKQARFPATAHLQEEIVIYYYDHNDNHCSKKYSPKGGFEKSLGFGDDFEVSDENIFDMTFIKREAGSIAGDRQLYIGLDELHSNEVFLYYIPYVGDSKLHYVKELSSYFFDYPYLIYCKGGIEFYIHNVDEPMKTLVLQLPG